MIRILVICTSGHGAGNGVTRHIMNYMALIAKNPDFKIFIGKNNADYQPNIDKFKEMGCQIADFPERFSRPLAYMRAIYRFIKNNKISIFCFNKCFFTHHSSSIISRLIIISSN